jgi:hypothetical protein
MSIFSNRINKKNPLFGKSYLSKKQIVMENNNEFEQTEEFHLEFMEDYVLIKNITEGYQNKLKWKFEERDSSSQTFIDQNYSQWIISSTHVTYTSTSQDLHITFILGDSKNKSKIQIENGIIETRVNMMKYGGMNINDVITAFHYCPSCKNNVISIVSVDNQYGNDLLKFAKTLRDEPQRIVGNEKKCKCGKSYTVLTKLIYQRTSQSNNFDVHYYFQYNSAVSQFAVEIISVNESRKVLRFSENDRKRFIGF